MNGNIGEEILKGINSALRSTKLYPAGHPAIKKSAEKTHELISGLLGEKENFLIGLVDGAMVFEETPIADGEKLYPELMEFMANSNVGTIIFERGLIPEEIPALIDLLTSVELQCDELAVEMKSRGITHVSIKSLAEGKRNFLEVYNGAVETLKEAMNDVRMGKIPRVGPVNSVIDEITESILADPNAMIGLTMIKNYDNYLYNHSVNVSILAVGVAREMKLSEDDIHAVGVGALLHDIGKTGVAEQIIRKPGGLSSEEWEKIKEHPLIGSEIIQRMEGVAETVQRVVYEHHIKYDLSGYPEKHGEIHPFSQIITICDAYDALTTLRVYQKPHNPVEAIKIMSNFSGRNFDPVVLKAFTEMIGIFPIGTMVRLSSNEIGIVTKINPDAPDRPSLKVLYGTDGAHLETAVELDLAGDGGQDRSIIATVNPANVDVELGTFFAKEVV